MATTAYPQAAVASRSSGGSNMGLFLAAGTGIVLAAGLWVAGKPQLLRIALPAFAAVVGWLLYSSRPVAYVSYSLWVWFLTPFVRRFVDWHFGFIEPNFVLLAPFLVSGISIFALMPSTNRHKERIPVAFVLCGIAIFYGFVVGMLLHPSAETFFGLVNWLCPMLFGLHLYLNWPQYEQYQAVIARTFVLALLILGLYGIFQFFSPPAWDRYWLENVKADSFGRPEPLEVRVWSTMNSPGPFANTMMAGLLLLLVIRVPLKLPSAIAGYLSLLLSVVRTAWLSWIVGFLLILKHGNPRVIVRLLLSILLLVACLVPLANDPRVATVIGDRFTTFTDLGHDASFGARLDMYKILIHDAANTPFGLGLRNLEVSRDMAVDSGILTLIFSLGWLGSSLFLTGVLCLFFWGERIRNSTDEFNRAAKAITFAILAQLIAGDVFVNVTGAIFWIFAAMYLAADHHYRSQATPATEPRAL
jgi:hypothetical protein